MQKNSQQNTVIPKQLFGNFCRTQWTTRNGAINQSFNCHFLIG